MSSLSRLWQKQRHRWYRRGIDKAHGLRRNLAYHVAHHGFEIGDYSYGDPIVRQWNDGSRLIIGCYCSIAGGVEFILGGMHAIEHVTTYPLSNLYGAGPGETPRSRGDIVIGSDVWIGAGAAVLSGVTIGHGAVIGAHALVTRDVAPYTVVAGNPAVPLRQRFADETVQQLLDLRWWELGAEHIRPLLLLLQSPRTGEFIEECHKLRAPLQAAGSAGTAVPTTLFSGAKLRAATPT
jgi:acetyltransferase-like isoleucine patch superfamily enzyme